VYVLDAAFTVQVAITIFIFILVVEIRERFLILTEVNDKVSVLVKVIVFRPGDSGVPGARLIIGVRLF
jgi:hypothetical protein